jgi:hypothetical protein
MNARKRNEIPSETGLFGVAPSTFIKPLEEEFLRVEASLLSRDSGFRKALSTLVKKEYGGKKPPPEVVAIIMEKMPALAAIAVNKSKKRAEWERLWARGTGKTFKALKDFPDQLREKANSIERLNRSFFFSPDHAINQKAPLAHYGKNQFLRLPTTLRLYAAWMEAWAKQIHGLQQKRYPPHRGHSPFIGYISTLTKLATGKFCDLLVSEVLNAADIVLNPTKPKSERRFHPQTIADLRFRQKKEQGSQNLVFAFRKKFPSH